MTSEIISVGTELLLGSIINTDAAVLSERLASLGISCYRQTVVGDNEERLTEVLEEALKRVDIVFLSGGLGPTEDDLTKETVAKVMGLKLTEDAGSRKAIEEFFRKRGKTPTDNNWKQALVPEGAKVVENPEGTAPGIIVEKDGKRAILMPGPPNEFVPMLNNSITPYLREISDSVIYSQTVKICGVGESAVESAILDIIDNQDDPTVATYAKTGEVHIRVTSKAADEKTAKKTVKPVIKELKRRFGVYIYATDDYITLEQSIIDMLKVNDLTMTVAESCTGGMLASRLVGVPGASDVFKAGFITYSNKSKRKLLGVRGSTLDKFGAVSSKTAAEMAKGASSVAKAQVAVSITGIAGPDGGTDKKPVGLVYICCFLRGKSEVREYHFSGNRNKVRESAVAAALTLLRQTVLEDFSRKEFGDLSEK